LIADPGVFFCPRNAGNCVGSDVGLPASGRLTPVSGLERFPRESTSRRVVVDMETHTSTHKSYFSRALSTNVCFSGGI
jgi:hypothetical protein